MIQNQSLSPDRCFSPEPSQRACARDLYACVATLPIVSPHGHVDPVLLADPKATLGTPAELFIIPDHYVYRMLYSQGVRLEDLGIPSRDGKAVETDHRLIWQRFADHYHLFAGTPTGYWLRDELVLDFGIEQPLNRDNAQTVYDQIAEQLAKPRFTPRALFERFSIEVLCTTDSAASPLSEHLRIRAEGWDGRVRPTFRPDAVVNIAAPGWRNHIADLSATAELEIGDFKSYVRALESRRAAFKRLGATATDHAALTPHAELLSPAEAEALFRRGMQGNLSAGDADRFTAHMLMEMARMSVDDGLVMQLHVGSYRNHHTAVFERFGADKGADIPIPTEWTRPLRPLLDRFGGDPRFRLILFTLDETTYARELAPLAGHYPAVFLGPPWWFNDSSNGIRRFLDNVVETAGLYNLAGFNDDTRAFASIRARHDLWRRVCCDWLAEKVVGHLVDLEDARRMAEELAGNLARRAYRLDSGQ